MAGGGEVFITVTTNGVSNGLVPLLRTFNSLARWIDQCLTTDVIRKTYGEDFWIRHFRDWYAQHHHRDSIYAISPLGLRMELWLVHGKSRAAL